MVAEEIELIRKQNLDVLFNPRAVAIIGASRKPGSIGRAIMKNIIDSDFEGTLYPVNPNASSITSIKCYPDIKSIPEQIDLAVIVVPQAYVEGVIRDAIVSGVRSAVIITAGFREVGEQGKKDEMHIIELARSINMRIIGPNCMGIINLFGPRLNATFAPNTPRSGKIGFISQSGALGVVILDLAKSLNLGLSKFVSLGNQADINVNDLIENFGEDENVEVILAYLESFADPWNFSDIATKTSRIKPIIVVKSGRTLEGSRAATSHTGALATSEITLAAILSRSGVIRVNSISELFDCAAAFSKLNLPLGDRVCVLTNSGGPGTITVDALIGHGMRVAQLSEDTKEKLATFLPHEASWENPIDLLASATPEHYYKALEVITNDPCVDAIITIFVPPIMIGSIDVANEIEKFVGGSIPILGVFHDEIVKQSLDYSFPVYKFPESAVKSLMALTEYALWRAQPMPQYEMVDIDPKILEIVPEAVSENRENLHGEEIRELLEGYGFVYPETMVLDNPDQIHDISNYLKYPVAVKSGSSSISHKTDHGAVFLNLVDRGAVKLALRKLDAIYNELDVPVGDRSVIIQEYFSGGVEMAIGISVDPQFGPMVMVGTGGIMIELMGDISFAKVPITRTEAKVMIQELKGYALLKGFRGEAPIDIIRLEDMLLRLSQLANENRDIVEVDINPILMFPKGRDPVVLDTRVRIANN